MFKNYFFIYLISQCFFSLCMEVKFTDNNITNQISYVANGCESYEDSFPFHQAIKKGCLNDVKMFVTRGFFGVNDLDDQRKSPLYYACLYREYEIIKFLLDNGVDRASISDVKFLAQPDYKEVTELLDLDKIDTESFLAILNKRLKGLLANKKILSAYLLMKKFSEVGKSIDADYSLTDDYGKNLLFYAVEYEDLEFISRFINFDININCVDKDGKPLLFYAIEVGNIELIKLLLSYSADLYVRDSKGNTALHLVRDKLKNPEIIKFLMTHGCKSDLDLIVSILLEMPQTLLRDSSIKNYTTCVGEGAVSARSFDASKLKVLLGENELASNLLMKIVKIFIRERNNKAVECLLLILVAENIKLEDLVNDFLCCNEDDPEMFRVLLDYNFFEKSQEQFESILYSVLNLTNGNA